MDLKKFDSLDARDFQNGAVRDEIRKIISDLEILSHDFVVILAENSRLKGTVADLKDDLELAKSRMRELVVK